jgi:hypothetical protein
LAAFGDEMGSGIRHSTGAARSHSIRAARPGHPANSDLGMSGLSGMRAVAARDERGAVAVYSLVEPASHYYRVMTRGQWMPVLIGETI